MTADLPEPFGPGKPKMEPLADGERDVIDRGESAELLVRFSHAIVFNKIPDVIIVLPGTSGSAGDSRSSTASGSVRRALSNGKPVPLISEPRSSRREEAHYSKSQIRNPKSEIVESLPTSAGTGFDARNFSGESH